MKLEQLFEFRAVPVVGPDASRPTPVSNIAVSPPLPDELRKDKTYLEDEEEFPSVETKSPKALSKLHNVSYKNIMKQLEKGIQVELEHTKDRKKAREIALDHLKELPDYYTRLKKMEGE